MVEKTVTLDEWSTYIGRSLPRGPAAQMDGLERVWRGWCQDEKCENHLLRLKVGDVIRIRLPKVTVPLAAFEPTPAR